MINIKGEGGRTESFSLVDEGLTLVRLELLKFFSERNLSTLT